MYDLSFNIVGLVTKDTITISNYEATFRNFNIGPNFIDISNINLLGPIYNYNIIITNTIIANIYKRLLTIIFSGGNKVYDTTLAPGILTYNINNIVNIALNSGFTIKSKINMKECIDDENQFIYIFERLQ